MEERILGARIRIEQTYDIAAFVAANVMNSLAKYDGGPMTAPRLLGRALVPMDPRLDESERAAWDDDDDQADAIEAARSQAAELEAHGLVRRGRLSPEELAAAQAGAHVH